MQLIRTKSGGLTRTQFERLSEIPAEEEWLANITNPKTRRAYKNDVRQFIEYTGLRDYTELRSIVRSHVIGWRESLKKRNLSEASMRGRGPRQE
jgi:integrase/recombinase XerD